MILYSIMPIELVFGNYYDSENVNKYIEMSYLGEKVQVMSTGNNEYVISRIISTSPKAFLNPRLQPGSVIKGEAIGQLSNKKV